MTGYHVYRIKLIHRVMDWDAQFQFCAPNARKARQWAKAKLDEPAAWLVLSASRVPNGEKIHYSIGT